MHCAITEAETHEMEGRMKNMEKIYLERIDEEIKMNKKKTAAKIAMLYESRVAEDEKS